MGFIRKLFGRSQPEASSARETEKSTGNIEASAQARADALILEGQSLEDEGKLDEAEALYRKALEVDPESARAWLNIGNVKEARGETEEAEACYRKAIEQNPHYGGAYANLGRVRMNRNDLDGALEMFSKAVLYIPPPSAVEAWSGIGFIYWIKDNKKEALAAYGKVLEFAPYHEAANLATARILNYMHQHEQAIELLERFLVVEPENADAHAILADAYARLGLIDEGLKKINRAYELEANDDHLVGRLFMLNSVAGFSPDRLFEEHRKYAEKCFAKYYSESLHHDNDRTPQRRLKVGYISADFKVHPVAMFIEDLFRYHDRDRFEIHAWHNTSTNDHVTRLFRELVDEWHDIHSLEDEKVAQQIRDVGIDILIDLSGFTSGHRLPVFALKPAPIQATWLGYLGTTGLKTMDYRICDAITDPPGMTEAYHTETLARMPHCQWCHVPYEDLPEVTALPMLSRGHLTLGAFNTPSKMNEQVLAVWADIMVAVDDAHIHFAAMPEGRGKRHLIEYMVGRGVDPGRLHFTPRLPPREYMESIREVDLALDTFPYNGGTTTFDTLIMGVPVVTLEGDHSIARGGTSIMVNLGLEEFVAKSRDGYVEIVRACAQDPHRMREVRQGLRNRLKRSPLMDGKRFTRDLEVQYQLWWNRWCRARVE